MRNFATMYEAVQYARTKGMEIECTIDCGSVHHVCPDGNAFCANGRDADGRCFCELDRCMALAAQVGAQIAAEGVTVLIG